MHTGYQADTEFHDSFQEEEAGDMSHDLSQEEFEYGEDEEGVEIDVHHDVYPSGRSQRSAEKQVMFATGAMFLTNIRKEKKRERYVNMKRQYGSEKNVLRESTIDYDRVVMSVSDSEMDRPSSLRINGNYGSFRVPRPHQGVPEEVKLSTAEVLRNMIFGSYINLLLLIGPFAVASYYLHWAPTTIFVLNFLTMVPLAALLGDFTEEAAAHTNQTIGGLINASFGNAVEVVVAIEALYKGEYCVVQASMIGSIFSNLLLVLGSCFFFGGLYYKEQTYSQLTATSNMGLLGLSAIALVLPTPFAAYYEVDDEEALVISRIAAVFLIFMYAQLLLFQLKTHAEFFEDDDEEETTLPFSVAIGGLVTLTLLIAKLSDFLVGSIDGFCEESGISRTFTGLIILPIVGNAVEHMTAVSVATKNKMDLAMGVAVGSSTQISLFVTPLVVIVGWIADRPMTLNFPGFEICLFVLSVIIVSIIVSYPKSNWLEGSLLITTYIMIAVGFWFEKVVNYQSPQSSEL